jgi:hypothetical protein
MKTHSSNPVSSSVNQTSGHTTAMASMGSLDQSSPILPTRQPDCGHYGCGFPSDLIKNTSTTICSRVMKSLFSLEHT